MLTVEEASKKVNVRPATIRRWVKLGYLSEERDKTKRGAPLLISPEELETVKAKIAKPGRPKVK